MLLINMPQGSNLNYTEKNWNGFNKLQLIYLMDCKEDTK